MKVRIEEVEFIFKCEHPEEIIKDKWTVMDLIEVGHPLCPKCDREMDLLTTCEVREDGGFW